MTTVVTTDRTGATANGTAAIPFTFQALSATEIGVMRNGVPIASDQYIVTLNGDGTGAVTPLTSWGTDAVVVFSNPSFAQPSSFTRYGPVYPDQFNEPLDRLARTAIALRGRQETPDLTELPLRSDLYDTDGSKLVGYVAADAGATSRTVYDALRDQPVSINDFAGATGADKIEAAYNALGDGDTLWFPYGQETEINRNVVIETGKSIRTIALGHKFKMTADGARLQFNGPVTTMLRFSANYVKGSYVIKVAHTGTQLNGYVRGASIKIVSDALDGWNRNEGTNANQYRLGEWNVIRKVVNNGDGTADITLWTPLMFTRGFTNTGSAENLVEGDSYTTALNARVIALTADTFEFHGGLFYTESAASHVGVSGWSDVPLLTVRGYPCPLINQTKFGPATGIGLQLAGCYDFIVLQSQVKGLPDNAEQLANSGLTSSYLGYGIAVAGCWGGSVIGLRGQDVRHAVTSNGNNVAANTTTYSDLMHMGRTFGTLVHDFRVGGLYSSAVDTHHDAHQWVFSEGRTTGTQANYAINLRGYKHQVIGGQYRGQRGINVMSDFQNAGGTDLAGLVGNGNDWMSSADIDGVNIDCTLEAIRAQVGYATVKNGANIRSASHYLFNAQGGVIDIVNGVINAKVTGEASAATVLGDTSIRGFFQLADADASYGVTWFPTVRIRKTAAIKVDATAATDGAVNMNIANQTGSTAQILIEGDLEMALPSSGMTSTPFNCYWTIDFTSYLSLTGNATIAAAYPLFDRGRMHISNLAPGVAQKFFTFRDGNGGPNSFVAVVDVYFQDANTAMLYGKYQIQDSQTGGSSSEATYLLPGASSSLEAQSNIDLSTTAATASKAAVSYFDGALYARHEIAGTTYEDVWAVVTPLRQSLKP